MPFLKAATVAANSGKLVPRAIIVKPIINSEIPKRRAVFSAKIIDILAPAISPTRPTVDKKKLFDNALGSDFSSSGIPSVLNKIYINSTNRPTKPKLSLNEIFPSTMINPNIRIDKPNGIKFDKLVLEAVLRYKHETPKIRAMFEIFEPIAVPKAMSSFPLITADIATNISGAEVPAAIRVNPTTRSLIPKCFAITEE